MNILFILWKLASRETCILNEKTSLLTMIRMWFALCESYDSRNRKFANLRIIWFAHLRIMRIIWLARLAFKCDCASHASQWFAWFAQLRIMRIIWIAILALTRVMRIIWCAWLALESMIRMIRNITNHANHCFAWFVGICESCESKYSHSKIIAASRMRIIWFAEPWWSWWASLPH